MEGRKSQRITDTSATTDADADKNLLGWAVGTAHKTVLFVLKIPCVSIWR